MPLHVVKPTPKPEESPVRKRLRATKPAEMLQCRRCGGREVIETRIGVEFVGGKTRGGTKALICAECQRRGERVVLP
jgi:hypothetical protein